MTSDGPTLDEIATTIRGAGPGLDVDGQRQALALLRILAAGEPVSPAALAASIGRSTDRAEAFIASLPGVYRDGEGRVIGFWGLTVADMPPHRYRVRGEDLFTWCAWDPFVLTPWLGGDAQVTSVDARTREPVHLHIADGRIADASHGDLALSFTLPAEWSDDVIATFCHFIHFFRDRSSARTWTGSEPDTFVIGVDEAFALGRVWSRAVLPDLDPSE